MALAACGGTGGAVAATYTVRFVHLIPNSGAYSAHLADGSVGADSEVDIGPLSPLETSPNVRVNGESTRWVSTIGSQPVPAVDLAGQPGSLFSVRVIGSLESDEGLPRPTARVVAELNDVPLRSAGLRVMHAAPGFGPLDIECRPLREAPIALATALPYGQISPQADGLAPPTYVPPGTLTIIVREVGQDQALVTATVAATANQLLDLAVVTAAGVPAVVSW
ncbi:MAG: DUF4397 domain-containing protein [Armatimonadetes bacterium]|nr:DUF4397 domain-containing protein [Armatimonadota bacterium]